MGLILVASALTVGGLGGLAGGWMIRRVRIRWCRQCGQPVGSVCIECRDRCRADNLRASRNQRNDRLQSPA